MFATEMQASVKMEAEARKIAHENHAAAFVMEDVNAFEQRLFEMCARSMLFAFAEGRKAAAEVFYANTARQDNGGIGIMSVKLKGAEPVAEDQPEYETIHVRRGTTPLHVPDPSGVPIIHIVPYMETAFMLDEATIARLVMGMPLVLRILGTQWPPYAINQVDHDQLDKSDPVTAAVCRGTSIT